MQRTKSNPSIAFPHEAHMRSQSLKDENRFGRFIRCFVQIGVEMTSH